MSIGHTPTVLVSSSLTSGIIGCYERANPINPWHYVQITGDKNARNLTWENREGVTWILTLIPKGDGWNTTNLAVGPDCPYFNHVPNPHKFAGLEWKGMPGASVLSAIRGPGNEAYQRKACPQGKYHKYIGGVHTAL